MTAPMSPSPTRSSNCHLGRCSPLDRLLLPHHMDMRPHLPWTLKAIKRTAEADAVGDPDPLQFYGGNPTART